MALMFSDRYTEAQRGKSAGPRSQRGPAGGSKSPGSSDTNGTVDAGGAGAGEAWDGRECPLHQEQSAPGDPKDPAERTVRAKGQGYREACGLHTVTLSRSERSIPRWIPGAEP